MAGPLVQNPSSDWPDVTPYTKYVSTLLPYARRLMTEILYHPDMGTNLRMGFNGTDKPYPATTVLEIFTRPAAFGASNRRKARRAGVEGAGLRRLGIRARAGRPCLLVTRARFSHGKRLHVRACRVPFDRGASLALPSSS